jgi:hypothetical protein
MEHLLQPKRALQELSRVCKGTLVVQVPTTTWIKKLGERIFGSSFKEIDQMGPDKNDKALPHVQKYVTKSLVNLLWSYNLNVTDVVGLRLVPLNLFTKNRVFVTLEYFFDLYLGTRYPFNMMGTMTILRCNKRK